MTDPTRAELAKRLRKAAIEPCDGCCYGETMIEAADALDLAEAEIVGLRECLKIAGHEMEQALQVAGAGFHLSGENMEGLRRATRRVDQALASLSEKPNV